MSRRDPTQALFFAALMTAAAMVALQVVGASSTMLPLHARIAAATWIGVGGVAAFAFRVTRARPRLGDVRTPTVAASLVAGIGLALTGTGALSVERALVPAWAETFAAKEAFFEQLIRPGELAFVPVVLLVTALGPALCEEFLFRGVLRSYLVRHVSRATRVLALGLLFALLHGDVTVLVPMAWVGAMLTLTSERAGGWASAAVAHFALNAFNAVVWTNAAAGFDPGLWGGLVMTAAGAGIAVAAVARIDDRRPGPQPESEPVAPD